MNKELFFKVGVILGISSITLSCILTPQFAVTVTLTAVLVCVLCASAYLFFLDEREKIRRQVIAYSAAAVASAVASLTLPDGLAAAVIAAAVAIAFFAVRAGQCKKVIV